MTTAQVTVTLLGLAAIVWVNWYFFLAGGESASVGARGSGPQQVRVRVRGGYSPAVIRVEAGRPVRLEFLREDTGSCTEEVVLPDFGIRTFLPPHQTTEVTFTPAAGTYEFACGMGMVRGKIVAENRS